MGNLESSYAVSAVTGLVLAAIGVHYWWEVSRRRERMNPVEHPLLLMRTVWGALVRHRGVFVLLLSLWTISALETWGQVILSGGRLANWSGAWFSLSLPLLMLALRGTFLAVDSTALALSLPHLMLAYGYAALALACGLAAWQLFAHGPGSDTRLRRQVGWLLVAALLCLGCRVLWSALPQHFDPVTKAVTLSRLWTPISLTERHVGRALAMCFGAALMWALVTGRTVSAREVVGRAAAALGPMMWLQVAVFVPLELPSILGSRLHVYIPMAHGPYAAIWIAETCSLALADVALMFAPWALMAEPRGWLAAARASLRAFRQHPGTMARFMLRCLMIFVPVFATVLVILQVMGCSLTGYLATDLVSRLATALLMATVALGYIHLTGEGASKDDVADSRTPVMNTEPAI